MPSTPASIISVKKARTDLESTPSKTVVLVVTRKPRCDGLADRGVGDLVAAFLADGEVVVLLLAVHVDGEGEVLARREEVQLFAQEQRVGAHVDVLLARDEALHDLVDLRVHERLAAGDGDGRDAAFVDRAEAFFRREMLLQNMAGILDFPASRARQIAAIERLQHQHERVPLASHAASACRT